jgi:diguanylate cyclase (GGDEF)-like protein/PAS domain S-box-containing protein
LARLKDVTQKSSIDQDSRRVMFRIVRDASDYVASFEGYLRYMDINAETEKGLNHISDQIQDGCQQVSLDVQDTIRYRIFMAIGLMTLIFVFSIVSALVLARFLSQEILKPIRRLVDTTKEIASGNLDARFNATMEDEIGELSRSFNLMTIGLKQTQSALIEKHRDLEEAHEELEQRVEERTQQLASVNDSLKTEITIRKQSESLIRASEEKFRAMFELSTLGMARNALSGAFLECNQALLGMLGYTHEALMGRSLFNLTPEEYTAHDRKQFNNLKESGHYGSNEKEFIHQDGHRIHVRMNGVLIKGSDGETSVWSIIEDITEKKNTEEIIWKQANFDSLTGLPNRRMFQNRLQQEMKQAQRHGHQMALLFLDLDKFKEVNDTLGHDKGDILLIEAARRIAGCVRETDLVARLGGDEFTVILSGMGNIDSVDRIANKIIDFLALPFPLGEDSAFVSASIGITLYPNDAKTLEELMSNADQAMYAAKEAGRNRLRYFTRSLQEAALNRMRLINDLRGAVLNEQFELHFQPIVDLASNTIPKAEALIRWRHPSRGLISPAEFIPLAEETRLIIEIGDWVFKKAAELTKHIQSNYYADFQVSINKSPVQFRTDQAYVDGWFAYLRDIGLPGKSIVIEITEGVLLDASDTIKNRLLEYRDIGIQVSLDDFGTGYSSLAYLNRFDIDFIKIDQSFVKNLAPDANELALCEAITVMAHKLGLKVIAEGVETEQQRELLRAAGCDYGQGYLFAKPLAFPEFEQLLAETRQSLGNSGQLCWRGSNQGNTLKASRVL